MSFFSEATNEGKVRMYMNSNPKFHWAFVLRELRQAGFDVDGMLREAPDLPL